MLPSGWTQATIDELISSRGVFRDGDWVESKDQDPDGNVRLIQLADIGEGKFRDKSSRFLTSEKSVELNCTFLEQGDVLVARMPDPLGRACLFPLDGDKKFVTVVDVCVIRFGHHLVDGKYFTYILNSPASRKKISDHQTGSTRKRISRGNLSTIQFPIAPLNEQHRIVAKIEELFSELDAGIESLKTAQAQLKVYRQSLLKYAFEGKLTAQWREQNKDKLESSEALLARIQTERANRYQQQLKEWEAAGKPGSKPKTPKPLPPLSAEELAELPELPEGWGWFKVGHICEVVRGGSPRPAGDPKFYGGSIPFLKVADITTTATPYLNTYTYTITEAGLNKTRQIEPNTLLLSNSGATLGVPKICLIAATMNDGVAAFLGLPQEGLLYHYYFWQSKTKELRNIDQGAAQPNLNTDLIKETFIPICSQVEQVAVSQKLEEVLSEADQLDQTLVASLQQAEALRQSILKKAFSGQLVPQDPHDELASVLLERIRAERELAGKSKRKSKSA